MKAAATATPTAARADASHAGKLQWRALIKWLREDDLISADDADQTTRRFAGGDSAQHPLVRLGSAAGVVMTGSPRSWSADRQVSASPADPPLQQG